MRHKVSIEWMGGEWTMVYDFIDHTVDMAEFLENGFSNPDPPVLVEDALVDKAYRVEAEGFFDTEEYEPWDLETT